MPGMTPTSSMPRLLSRKSADVRGVEDALRAAERARPVERDLVDAVDELRRPAALATRSFAPSTATSPCAIHAETNTIVLAAVGEVDEAARADVVARAVAAPGHVDVAGRLSACRTPRQVASSRS